MSKVTNNISNNNGTIKLCSVVIVEGYLRKFGVANKRENILYVFPQNVKTKPHKSAKSHFIHAQTKQIEHFPRTQKTE